VRDPGIAQFLHDASCFVASSREAIELSAPHIYLSAIPFADQNLLVYKEFSRHCTGLIAVDTLGIRHHSSRAVMLLTGHFGAVRSIAYSSPARRLLASGSEDGTVRVWDTRTGEEALPPLYSDDGPVLSVDFARNDRWIASGCEAGIVSIWDVTSHQKDDQRLGGHAGPVNCVVFSQDSTLLASASDDKTVRLWNPEEGTLITVLSNHTEWVNRLSFSPDGQVLVSISEDRTIRLWNRTGKAVRKPLEPTGAYDLDFSPDGDMIAGAFDDEVIIWKSHSGEIVMRLHADARTHSIRFSPNGRMLVAACGQGIRMWTLQSNHVNIACSDIFGHAGEVYSAIFSQDGLHIASASEDGTIRIWSAKGSQSAVRPLPAHASAVNAVAVSRDGAFIVSGSDDQSVRVWNARTGMEAVPPLYGHTRPVLFVTISQNGRLIASASADCTVRLWDAQSGAVVGKPIRHLDGVVSLSLSSDEHWLASASHKAVRLWNITRLQLSPFGPLRCKDVVQVVAFSLDDERIAAGDESGNIHLWRTNTGEQACEPLKICKGKVISLAFSPSDTCLAAGAQDHEVYIWDVSRRQCILTLQDTTGSFLSVAWSLDGRIISTASRDQEVRLWNAQNGTLLATLYGHSDEVRSVTVTPDGRCIVSGSKDNAIRMWDVDAAYKQVSEQDAPKALPCTTLVDGWLLGPIGELLMWVPAGDRANLRISPCTMLISHSCISVTIGSSGWHRGVAWISCWY